MKAKRKYITKPIVANIATVPKKNIKTSTHSELFSVLGVNLQQRHSRKSSIRTHIPLSLWYMSLCPHSQCLDFVTFFVFFIMFLYSVSLSYGVV